MDETLMLILLVIVMLVGSYLAGNIPLIMNLSEEKLKIVSIFGAGLLVGTALTVIIPEGIRALYTEITPNNAAYASQSNSNKIVLENHHDHNEPQNEHSFTIGFSLVLGFIFMMLIDQISSRRNEGITPDKNMTATIGLVVHAAADGIALGAAATTSHHDVEIIVFLAIMLHKAPAAFGLVSFLLHEGINRKTIRKHLGIFSLSAPLLTLLTYFGIGQEQKETLNSVNATGIAMLFSAGTFLYVATVHVLPELTQSQTHHNYSINYSVLEQQTTGPSTSGGKSHSGTSNLKYSELFILIFGALLPLLLTWKHHH